MKKLLLAILLLGILSVAVHAQSSFSGDLRPSVSYRETYTETYTWYPDYYYYDTNPSSAISLTGTNFSLSGVTFDEDTEFSISLGDFYFDEVLGDASDYDPASGTASFPFTTWDANHKTIQCGTLKLKWTASALSFSLTFTSPQNDSYPITAYNYSGMVGPIPQSSLIFDFVFSDREYTRQLFYKGSASTKETANSIAGNTPPLPTVSLSGAFDTTPPTVAIQAPAAQTRFYFAQIPVSGTVHDTQIGPKTVNIRVNNDPITSLDVTGTESWTTPQDSPATLNEGTNTISVQAIDLDGNVSGWVSTTCSYTRTSPLFVSTASGSGTTSISGSSFQLTGSIITVKATPGPGYLFDHWEGNSGIPALGQAPTPLTDSQSKQATLKFAMQPFASVQAVFSPNPFVGITGNYSGTIFPYDQPSLGGSFNLTLTPSGNFTGKLTSKGATYAIKGQFDASGQFTGTFGTAKNPITLWLSVDLKGGKQVTGSASVGPLQANASITSDLVVWSASNPIPSGAGSYTFLIPAPSPGDTSTPQGNGFGTATITPDGTAKLTGILGDGSKFTASCRLSKDLAFNFSCPIYNKLGNLSGLAFVSSTPGSSDFSGYMLWFKPPSKGAVASDGFTLMPALVGSLFNKSSAVDFSGGTAYVSFMRSGSELASTSLVLASSGLTSFKAAPLPNSAPNPEKFTLVIQPATGYFSGSYSNGSASVPFKGVLFQDQFLAAGLTPKRAQNGSVLIQAKDHNTGYISLF